MTALVSAPFDLRSFLAAERLAVEAALRRLLDDLLADAPPAVAEPVRYAAEGGGKRLRPILCIAAFRAAGGDPHDEGAYTVACAVELIHAYSLVHDDLPCMDDDDLRRGRPATHRVFGEHRASVAGLAMVPLACAAAERGGVLLGLARDERAGLVRELCAGAGGAGMVGGQVLDLEAEGRSVPLDELEAIHRSKTGALLKTALRLGGMAARAPARVLDALDAYGDALGLAFQITDDVLDVTGRSAVLGKTAGRDEALAKATFPALLGIDGARGRARAELERAHAALHDAGLETRALAQLARYAVERDR